MRAISHPATEQLSLPGVLHALSDPVRLEIVKALAEVAELSCGELVAPVSKSTLSHHLKVLRDAGLTQTRAVGVQRLVSLRARDIEARFPGLLDCVLAHSGGPESPFAGVPVPAHHGSLDPRVGHLKKPSAGV